MDTPTHDEIDRLLATYGPNRPPAYAVLRPCVDLIRALRQKGASFETVRQILRVRGVTVSESSVRNFCREILGEASAPGRDRRRRVRRIEDPTPSSGNSPGTSSAIPPALVPVPEPASESETESASEPASAPVPRPDNPPVTNAASHPRPRGPRIANLKRTPSSPP